jgi:hypothetical protein
MKTLWNTLKAIGKGLLILSPVPVICVAGFALAHYLPDVVPYVLITALVVMVLGLAWALGEDL